jgi:ATP-dependent DNA helicase RecQ
MRATLQLLHEGYDLNDIAQTRGMTRETVENHIAEAIEAGEDINLDQLVHPQRRKAIEAAFAELGPAPLKPVLERVGGDYTYGELRLVRAAMHRHPEHAE